MDFKEQYNQYENTLNTLKNQCAEAEKQSIIAETNLDNLRKQRERLIEECETFTGTTIDKIPDLLTQTKEELESIMTRLSTIDTHGEVTPEKLVAIRAIADEFGIPSVE